MEFENVNVLIERAKQSGKTKRMAIIAAGEAHVIDAALHAWKDGIVEYAASKGVNLL